MQPASHVVKNQWEVLGFKEIGQTSSWLAGQWVSMFWFVFFFLFILADLCTDELITGEETDASYLITPTTSLA